MRPEIWRPSREILIPRLVPARSRISRLPRPYLPPNWDREIVPYRFAITVTALGSLASTTGATSYATSAAYTPSANALVLAIVGNRRATAATLPTFSGNSLTWVQEETRDMAAGGTPGRLTAFRAMGGSPTNGTGTADFGADTQEGCSLSVFECTGVDTSGTNGSGAVRQSEQNGAASGTALTVTLAAFGDAVNNVAIGAFLQKTSSAAAVGTGYTQIHNLTFTVPNTAMITEYILGQDLSVDATGGASAEWGGIALEIVMAVAAGGQPAIKRMAHIPHAGRMRPTIGTRVI